MNIHTLAVSAKPLSITVLLRLQTDNSTSWTQVLQDRGHTVPAPEFLNALASWSILQARMPIRKGGLGLVSAEETSPSAYLGGLACMQVDIHCT